MKCSAEALLQSQARGYYLFGEDRDGVFEAADALFNAGDKNITRLRVDCNDLGRIEVERSNQGLFGSSDCYALVRNAESATPKQGDHLLKLATTMPAGSRIIICAADISWKKAFNKKIQALSDVAQCEFSKMNESTFNRWLKQAVEEKGVRISDEAMALVVDRLCGLRLAARQLIQRLAWYDDGRGEILGLDVVGDLLGERAPQEIEVWCHAVAIRDQKALSLLANLLASQQVAEVQLISWLGTRMQQVLMYLWYQSKHDRNALISAKVFGDARKHVPAEAKCWKGSELTEAMLRIMDVEKLLKGASVEDKHVVLERLTLDLVMPDRLLRVERIE